MGVEPTLPVREDRPMDVSVGVCAKHCTVQDAIVPGSRLARPSA